MPGRVLSGHSMGLVVILLGSHTFKCGLLVECQFVYEIFTGSNSSQVSVRVDTFCSPTYQKTMSSLVRAVHLILHHRNHNQTDDDGNHVVLCTNNSVCGQHKAGSEP